MLVLVLLPPLLGLAVPELLHLLFLFFWDYQSIGPF